MQNHISAKEIYPLKATEIKWATVSEAARFYRVSRNTIYQACQEGEMKYTRIRTTMRIPININEKYLTVSEVARALNVSPSTVYEACALKEGPGTIEHIRVRSRIRIPASSFYNSFAGCNMR